jgi:biotin carboxyl carrier protein
VDPRAVRVTLVGASAAADATPVVVEPAVEPGGLAVIDGIPTHVRLDRPGPVHAVLVDGGDPAPGTRLLLLPAVEPAGQATGAGRGTTRREIVVDGWRFEVEVDSERRARLRERARRGGRDAAGGGPAEVHAMIPGVVVAVAVVPGDAVTAGQRLLVVEAMKMQNEVRAPRDGIVGRVAVGERRTIEVGDLLLVLE